MILLAVLVPLLAGCATPPPVPGTGGRLEPVSEPAAAPARRSVVV